MSEIPYEDFSNPSEMSAGGGAHPSLAQLSGRLVWLLPTAREDGVTTERKTKPHTKLTCDAAFLTGDPIDRVVRKDGTVSAELDPPVQPGQIMVGRWVNQEWIVNRLRDRVGQPGFPGMIGIVTLSTVKGGNTMWVLSDPSPDDMNRAKAWFAWMRSQPDHATRYVPNAQPVAPPAQPPASPFAPQAAPSAPPFAAPAAPAATPDPWAVPSAQPTPAAPFPTQPPPPPSPPFQPQAPVQQQPVPDTSATPPWMR